MEPLASILRGFAGTLRVEDCGFRVKGLGFSGFRVKGLGFSGFRVKGLRL